MTNNKQQTAVEWFLHELITFYIPEDLEEYGMFMKIVEQAKEMHKEETIEFAINYTYGTKRVGASLKEDFIKLYKQTYEGGEQ